MLMVYQYVTSFHNEDAIEESLICARVAIVFGTAQPLRTRHAWCRAAGALCKNALCMIELLEKEMAISGGTHRCFEDKRTFRPCEMF